MSGRREDLHPNGADVAPGVVDAAEETVREKVGGYLLGLALATLLTIAQIGIHLAFFLHITSAPDNTNNILALAFGVLIVVLVVAGSLWIMDHLNQNMLPMDQMMQMQR
jgi:cytochrome o ubiquinol oxidase operon protein cyoD